ncbi:hypothetical protein SeLEV6574_g08524 [Synchytrium endobioticum]|uniref:Lactate/malate dehydrogenase C-terminal domain-containing protein n=2 Tax=Synchytrium endobioticum TaxID=286115 RepID=A0A507BR32_9FUNG|nr:hypothetical protein SeLEV6574_g08524 [Synchytrium endobioticum]
MAYAGARFANSILEATVLGKTVTECAYVNSDVASADGLEYFSTETEFGKSGIVRIFPIPQLSDYEKKLYAAAVPELKANIEKGVEFVKKSKPAL